ncbi:MAG: hypothetical protein J6570_05440 [Snodgrassella sp.]|nr:hypothetical protein [Snodgrassella sp.]
MTNIIIPQYHDQAVLNSTASSGRLFYQTDKPLIFFILWCFVFCSPSHWHTFPMVDNGREALRLPVLINGLPALPFFCRPMRLEAHSGLVRIIRKGSVYDYFCGGKSPFGSVHVTPVSSFDDFNEQCADFIEFLLH